jgi:hypothetical protein
VARTLNLKAPDSIRLMEMGRQEVEKHVAEHAERVLDSLSDVARPIGVNAVSLNQTLPGTGADPGFWAEWTRACCGSRAKIEDFSDPVIEQFERPDSPVVKELAGEHLESQMRIQELEHPTKHVRGEQR